jgi:Ala-tRNA(Pro) deacylase
MSVYTSIIARLDEQAMQYTTEHHEPTITSVDAAKVRGVSLHAGAKALVIRGNKSKQHWLFVMPADLRLSSAKVTAIIGEKFSFAPDPEAVTGCVRGSVPPLGSILGLKTYCDVKLAENEMIHFNAGSLTDSVTMRYDDYVRLEKPMLIDITE